MASRVMMTSRVIMTSVVSCQLLCSVPLPAVEASAIMFNGTSTFVKPLFSTNLTLTCKLQDTSTTPLPVIGKRKRSLPNDVTKRFEEEMRGEDKHNNDVTSQ